MTASNYAGPRWRDGLNGPALRIAEIDVSPLRVSAGPGTGKTYALMRRIARLVEEGADPRRILVVTFTRTAARDLRREIERLTIEGASEVVTSTLHSYCMKTLKTAAAFEFTGRSPRVVHDFERAFLLEDMKLARDTPIRRSRALIQEFEAAWSRLEHEQVGWPIGEERQAFHNDIMSWLRFHECMLIGELPTLTIDFLEQNPAVPEASAFDHVLVDEFQDLNRADQKLIDLISFQATLTIIGDEDQSIYGGIRFAQPEGIRNFHETHVQTHSETMDVCRRCPAQVVRMANELIQVNRDRAPRQLIPEDEDRVGMVRIVQWPTLEAEATGLAQFVHRYRTQNPDLALGKVLILSPRAEHGKRIALELRNLGIPAVSYFSESMFRSDIAQERFTLLTLVVRPTDRPALRAWLGFDYDDGAATPYRRIRTFCEANGASPAEALASIEAQEFRFRNSARMLEKWQSLNTQRERIEPLAGTELVDALFPDDQVGLEALRDISLSLVEQHGEELSPDQIHDSVVERMINPEPPDADDHVRVMSIYKAKGLTSTLTVLAGAIEVWYPKLDDLEAILRARQEEEQRRLFYVGVTRPTEALIISSFGSMPSATAHRTRGRGYRQGRGRDRAYPSRFVREMQAVSPMPITGDTLLEEFE